MDAVFLVVGDNSISFPAQFTHNEYSPLTIIIQQRCIYGGGHNYGLHMTEESLELKLASIPS